MLLYLAESPSPAPTLAHHVDRTGLIVLAVVVAAGAFVTWWARRAAARYRKRLHEQDGG